VSTFLVVRQVKLRKSTLVSEEAESRLEQSKSAFLELHQNVERLQRQNEALLQERVQLYMEKQNLESALSVATTDKDNLDKELVALVNMPTRLAEISSQGVRQIACGDSHTLALAESGDVYAWGGGRSGQLGLGKRRSYPAPQLVWGMMRKGVRQIGAGANHSAALTYNGYLFTWGSSSVGQLGHGNRRTMLQPTMVEALEAEARERSSTVRLVGCGRRHTVAVLANGDLYLWGRPDSGILGRSKGDMVSEPQLVEALWRREVQEGHVDKTRSLGAPI
jgi:alpha-tubulin suppressor-like RCC1 family protein